MHDPPIIRGGEDNTSGPCVVRTCKRLAPPGEPYCAECRKPAPFPDGPGDAAGPNGSADIIPSAIFLAMGISRTTFYDHVKKGNIPAADRPTPGGHGRYSVALAAKIVRDSGHDVPASWGAPANGGRAGCCACGGHTGCAHTCEVGARG
jgi:hypothetical protein